MDEKLSRRKSRENAFITLFSASFGEGVDEVMALAHTEQADYAVDAFGAGLLALYRDNAETVDRTIEQYLKDWKLNRLPRVSLAILRISAAEMLFGQEDLDSVIINEAVETAKRFGGDEDYQFINGVLGSIARAKPPQGEETV